MGGGLDQLTGGPMMGTILGGGLVLLLSIAASGRATAAPIKNLGRPA